VWQRILDSAPGDAQAKEQAANMRQIAALYEQVKVAATDRDYAKMLDLCQQILAIDPNNQPAKDGYNQADHELKRTTNRRNRLLQEAQEEARVKNFKRALDLCDELLEIDPNNVAAQQARESIKRAKKDIDNQIKRLVNQAEEAEDDGNWDEALNLWQQIKEIDKTHQKAIDGINRAKLKKQEEDDTERDQLVRQAREAVKAKRWDEAVRLWTKVKRLDPRNTTNAAAELDKANRELNKQKKEIEALLAKAQEAENRQQLEEANRYWQQILAIDPNNAQAKNNISTNEDILRREKEREKEREAGQKRQIDSLLAQAQNEEKAGKLDTALETYKRVLTLAPNNSTAQQAIKRINEIKSRPIRKVDYAVAASIMFVEHLHRQGFDRGMVATFGTTANLVQGFTSNKNVMEQALLSVASSVTNEGTRLYDSIYDIIQYFWANADRRRPWLLTIVTDGIDNVSDMFLHTDRRSPAVIGAYMKQYFNDYRNNFAFLIGVGTGNQIDVNALSAIGNYSGIPAITIDKFPVLEQVFVEIALQVTSRYEGRNYRMGNLTWQQVDEIRSLSHIAIDYGFLLDRSGSMSEPG
jgi:tetratricopeptide (TPR) repeat protein